MKNKAVDFRLREYDRMIASLKVFNVPEDLKAWIFEAYNDESWDWTTSNGCDLVSEVYWPTRYYPVCVAHDHKCAIAQKLWKDGFYRASYIVRWKADKMFYRANRAYGMGKFRSAIRFIGVRIGAKFITRWLKSRR